MNCIKMAKLDLLTIKPFALIYFLLGLFIGAVISFSSDSFVAVSVAAAWSMSLLGMVSFQVQETNSLERFYYSVSLKASDVVLGRFLSMLALFAITLFANLIVFLIVMYTKGLTPEPTTIVLGALSSLLFFAVMTGLTLPFLFGMGFTKGRLISSLFLYGGFASFILLASFPVFSQPIGVFLTAFNNYLIPSSIAAIAIIFCLSYRVSLAAYMKQR